MTSYGRGIGLVGLILTQAAMADAGSLQLNVEQGQIAIRAHGVELGRILEALSHRTGTRVVIDEQSAERPVTIALETKSVAEAIWELLRRTGGGTSAVLYNAQGGYLETFRLGRDREKAVPAEPLRPPPPHPLREPRDVAAPLAIPPPALSSASSISVLPQGTLVPALPHLLPAVASPSRPPSVLSHQTNTLDRSWSAWPARPVAP